MNQPQERGDDPLQWQGQPTRSGRIERLQKNNPLSPRSIRQMTRDRKIWDQINAE